MTTESYFLSHGSHASPAEGRCAMEWVAYLAGENHSDSPVCVSPVLRAYGMSLNDRWDDEQRQKLRPYLARCIGTAGDGRDPERAGLAIDWMLREFLPAFLDLVPSLQGHARLIRACPPVVTFAELDHCMNLVNVARSDSRAARDAARAAAHDAAYAAARDAAYAAAHAAARDAARAAARDAARAAAYDAARDAAYAAAYDAAYDAAYAAAARDALRPAVIRLQVSALELFDRMLPTEAVQMPAVGWAESVLVCGVDLR